MFVTSCRERKGSALHYFPLHTQLLAYAMQLSARWWLHDDLSVICVILFMYSCCLCRGSCLG